MALTKKDLDLIRLVVIEGVEQIVTPRFEQVDSRLDGMEQRLERRIDKLAEVVTDVKTNHEKRIRKLEEVSGIKSPMVTL